MVDENEMASPSSANDTAEEVELMGKDIRMVRKVEMDGEIAAVGIVICCSLKAFFYSMKEGHRLRASPFEEGDNESFQIGEGDCYPGLELGLRHSRVGETLLIRCSSRFAFGSQGRLYDASTMSDKLISDLPFGTVPPDMDVEYEVVVHSHIHPNSLAPAMQTRYDNLVASLKNEEDAIVVYNRLITLQQLTLRKEAGNRWFNIRDYQRAAKAYSQATKLADNYFNQPSKDKIANASSMEEKAQAIEESYQGSVRGEDEEVVAVYMVCLNNLIAVQISLKNYLKAKELCVKLLEIDPRNVKGLIRAAKVSLALDLFEECETCLKVLNSFPPDSHDSATLSTIAGLQSRLTKERAAYRDKTKAMQQKIAKGLFGGSGNGTKASAASSSSTPSSSSSSPISPISPINPSSTSSDSSPKPTSDTNTSSAKPATATDPAPAAASTTDKVIESYHKSAPNNSNLFILLATSLAVLVISLGG
eukprot:gene30012-36248_t